MQFAIDISGSSDDEASSFVVLAPSGADFRSEPALREVEAFLKGSFPGLEFYANGDAPPFDGGYQVLPIRGVPGDDPDTLRMLDHPGEAVMLAIGTALQGYRPRAALN